MEWINLGIGVLGIVLTIVGFWIAIVQINRTKTAATAAKEAVTVGTLRIRYNQLIILVPQLQNLETELDAAVRYDDEFTVERVLVRWRAVATQVGGILSDMGDEHKSLTEAIQKTCGVAISAKSKLKENAATKGLSSAVAGVRKELSVVNDRLSALVGALATQAGGGAAE